MNSDVINLDGNALDTSFNNVENNEKIEDRGRWANKAEFLLSCLGYAIGIGNVWRFPYLCYRSGGGAFLVPYLLMLFFCGVPLFFMETSLGQFSSSGCITVFKIAPLFKGAGYAIVIVNLIVTIYFTTLISYPLLFLVYCFQPVLPWTNCDNPWNTGNCIKLSDRNSSLVVTNITDLTTKHLKTPTDEFFHHKILQISGSIDDTGEIVWPIFFCNLFSWIIVFLCIMKGVKSVGKVVYFTATFPFFVLFVLLIRGVTLPGAMDGIWFYIYPQWNQLTNFKVWSDAAVQIFFSLGPGWGGIINMASYNDFSNNNKLDSIIVPLMNCGTSIFAGFVVFSVIGFMAHETGLPISTVATGGPGLAFITYPEAVALLPFPHLWAILFFLMLFFLGLDSVFVGVEAVITSITDEYPILRRYKTSFTFAACCVMLLASNIFTTNSGFYWLSLFDYYSASISVILICLVEVIIIGWTYGILNFVADIEFMIKEKVSWYWIVSWKISTPIILLFIFITTISFSTRISYNGVEFPTWAIEIGWASCIISMACIPLYIGYELLYIENGDLFERIKSGLKPKFEWGPANHIDRLRWLVHVKGITTEDKYRKVSDNSHEQFLQLCTLNP